MKGLAADLGAGRVLVGVDVVQEPGKVGKAGWLWDPSGSLLR